jgi:hypothetical protein
MIPKRRCSGRFLEYQAHAAKGANGLVALAFGSQEVVLDNGQKEDWFGNRANLPEKRNILAIDANGFWELGGSTEWTGHWSSPRGCEYNERGGLGARQNFR